MANMQNEESGQELLTLSEVSERTKISMPTLGRYKKLYQDRIPSVGKGRKQRYYPEALAVFEQLKEENIGRRGRPRKSDSDASAGTGRKGQRAGAKRKPPAKKKGARGRGAKAQSAAEPTSGLLTLTEIGERTGISYPTLNRYVKLHGDAIPHEGKGRKRRYYPEAVEVFRELRSSSRRGGAPRAASVKRAGAARSGAGGARAAAGSGDVTKRIAGLEKAVISLEKKIDTLISRLQKPRPLI